MFGHHIRASAVARATPCCLHTPPEPRRCLSWVSSRSVATAYRWPCPTAGASQWRPAGV